MMAGNGSRTSPEKENPGREGLAFSGYGGREGEGEGKGG